MPAKLTLALQEDDSDDSDDELFDCRSRMSSDDDHSRQTAVKTVSKTLAVSLVK